MFVIRADGNSKIGMGHIMRCLSIADAMKQQGVEPLFVTACEEGISVIEQRGFQAILLTTDYKDMLSELPQIKQIFREEIKKHVILVDSYQVSEAYYRELSKMAYVACLEDMGEPYPVDLLINYNIYAENLISKYEADSKIMPRKTLLGVLFMPLRQEFLKDCKYDIKEKVTNVMVTTGGSDPLFATKAFLDAFLDDKTLQRENILYHVISGPFNSHADELKKLYENTTNVLVYENVKNMKEIMLQCDVILTATGSTVYEVCALGVPMFVFYFVNNQRQAAEEIEKKLGVINCGDFSLQPCDVIRQAVNVLTMLIKSREKRMNYYEQEKKLIDGHGAERIAEALIKLI